MIITTTNAIVNVPLSTPIAEGDKFVLTRGTLTVEYDVVDTTDTYAQVMIPSTQTTGEWNYTLGGNRGVISINRVGGNSMQYDGSAPSLEYDGLATLPDAPSDGVFYGRKNHHWVPGAEAGALTEEAAARVAADTTLDGKITAETQRAQGVETSLNAAIATKIGDAPSDGNEYARKNGTWAKIEGGGGGGIPDVTDSKKYVRTQGQWAEGMTKTEITAAIGVEKTRAENAESALSGRIDTADAAISAEVSRATAAEGVNAAAISAEETRAEGAESALGLRIDGVSGDITAEEAARAAADTALGLRIDGKGDTPTIKSAWESDNTPVDNTIYNLGTTAALTIAATPTSNSMGVAIYFTSGATATTFSYPVTTKWVLSEAPTIEANKEYCITILDGVYNCIEVTTLTHN